MSTLFMSDLHLGNPACHADKIIEILEAFPYRDSIWLVGDVLDDHQLKLWPSIHCDALQRILEFNEIIYIPGNHDAFMKRLLWNFMPNRLDGQVINITDGEATYETNGKRYLVTHGDKFDWTIRWMFISSRTLGHWSRHFFSGLHSWFNHQNYINRLIAEAKRRGYDGVICGHNHEPAIEEIDGIMYINCGDFVENDAAVIEDAGLFYLIQTSNHQDNLAYIGTLLDTKEIGYQYTISNPDHDKALPK